MNIFQIHSPSNIPFIFFLYRSGVVFDWDAAGHDADEEGRTEHYSDSTTKGDKNTKLGKMFWTETPAVKKGTKTVKNIKGMKGTKGRLMNKPESKEADIGYYPSTVEAESSDGWLAAFEPSNSITYSDLFESSTEVQQRNDFANPGHVTSSEFKANGGSTLITGRMGGPEAPSARKFHLLSVLLLCESIFLE